MTCQDLLGFLLAAESDDPALQAKHFLTVACYNLQHPARFTDAALAGLRAVFMEYLDHGLPITDVRRRVGRTAQGEARVLRRAGEPCPEPRAWRTTIADVFRPDHAEGAAERVRAWARSIRSEL